ncbi:MAG: hypothetical protein ACI9R3_004123 [Verrucomicrobiales bacterium]|jgi:hypothetical protein
MRSLSLYSCATALLFFASLLPTEGGLYITEFMTSNGDTLRDSDGDASDWIEIFNTGPGTATLDGSYLTDDASLLAKWRFPAIELEEGRFLLVFASGKNRTAPESELHTNFQLANDGEFLALVAQDGFTIVSSFGAEGEGDPLPSQIKDVSFGRMQTGDRTPAVLIESGASCKVHVPRDESLGATWTGAAFDDATWDAAAMGIGYEDGNGYVPEFGAGGNLGDQMSGVNTSVYLRVPFEVTNTSTISELTLNMKYDDGFAAFLNGTRVAAGNAPGALAWDSDATSNHSDGEATTFLDFDITAHANILNEGANILAIHGLNDGLNSSDMLISAELRAFRVTAPTIGGPGFLGIASPGALNGDTFGGFVADTKFSVSRGFFDAPFEVEITTSTEGAEIRYTIDGTDPTATQGTVYSGAISIAETTILRAIAHRDDYKPTNIDTQSYLFPEDVVDQPRMRAAITQSQAYGPQMIDSLKAVPTISLVTDHTAFENESSGNIRDEHKASVEMIFPDGTPGFQENGGMSNYGGRFTNFRKKSFRVAFRKEFGESKLKYPIFDGFEYDTFPPADEFDVINLRSGSHDMQSRGAYMSNRFADDSMLDMGNIAPHGRFVHVYLNGNYWGQYHLRERWSADMASSYFGGPEEDYEAVNANDNFQNDEEVYDGNGQFWEETKDLVAGANPFTNAAAHIDIANIVDFMLLWVSGNSESEFRAFGSEAQSVPFKFMMKDADGFLRSPGHATDHAGPLSVMSELQDDPDYAIFLADRIHKHFFNDGALTPARNIERLSKRVDEARPGFTSEAARWGDVFREPSSWESYQQNLVTNHFPDLTQTMISRFKSAGMYPEMIAPVYNQHGGSVSTNTPITMATDADRIYFTIDASDPRQPGGSPNPNATVAEFAGGGPTPITYLSSGHIWRFLDDGSNQESAWQAAAFDDSNWQSGPSSLGYGSDNEDAGTTVGFGADSSNKQPTTYFRTTVDIQDPSIFFGFLLRVKYDDGVAIYINGSEQLRQNLAAGAAFDDFAQGTIGDEGGWKDITLPTTALRAGTNTIAVEIHQGSATSSDIRLDMVLRGETTQGGGGNITDPNFFDQPTLLRARSFNSTSSEWSALNEAFFSIDTVPADSSNLVLSEFHYHPADPTSAAEIIASEDRDDYEFIEFTNVGAATLDLTGVRFIAGINFAFPDNTLLRSGERLLLVRNSAAFETRYTPPAATQIFEYTGRLSNDGEQILLQGTSSNAIRDFTYNDQLPWPTDADGEGKSLVLLNPTTNPPHGDPTSWSPSRSQNGSPGTDEPTGQTYATWAIQYGIVDRRDEDDDGDGISNYFEFLFGSRPDLTTDAPAPTANLTNNNDATRQLLLTYRENLEADGATLTVEFSFDLTFWASDPAVAEQMSRIDKGDGTATVTVRLMLPAEQEETEIYLRMRGE